MAEQYAKDYEDVTGYTLDTPREFELRNKQNECTFIWTNKQGEPVGVIMSYVDTDDGRLWLTGAEQRKRFPAIRRNPHVCVVISSTGTNMGSGKTVTYKGIAVIHDKSNRKIKDWFYRALAEKLYSKDGKAKVDQFVQFLDSPARVVVEVIPTKKIVFDGDKMAAATPAVSFSES